MPGKKQENERKRKKAVAMCQDITRYTKKAKQVGVVGDDSLTGPVIAGRLDETTASTTDDSASLSGSVFSTVVVADGRETEHSPILFPVPHSDQKDASGSLLSSEAYVYDLSAHPPTPPVIPIITTSIYIDSLNVTAEIDEFKNDVGLFLIGQQPPYVLLQAMTLGQKYHLFA